MLTDSDWKRAHDKREREQSCLYDVATILRNEERALEQRLEAVLERIPDGWRYPEAAVVRLVRDGDVHTTDDWPAEGPTLRAPVESGGDRFGSLELRYRDERPEEDMGPYLEEERRLLEEIAGRVAAEIAQERAKRRLDASEQRFRSLFEQNPNSVVIFSREGRFVAANPATERITGYPPEELEGRTFDELLDPEVREQTRDRFERSAAGETLQYETRVRHRDGYAIDLDVTTVPVVIDGRVEGVFGVSHDVTERKRLERRLRQSNRDLEQFAYVASHDLQEPLRMVSGYLQLVDERYGDRLDEDAREFIDYAVDGALRMKKMISDLLDYSRVSTRGEEPAPVDAGAALEQAVAGLGVLAEEAGADVSHGELPTVMADENQLVRVFQNLITNAIRHGGEAPRIEVTAEREGDRWRFSVADDGPGIARDQQERIFKIFESLQRPDGQQSTGIGLAICRRIVERHGGRIWVESEPGEGATFHFTMPAAGTIAPDASEPAAEER